MIKVMELLTHLLVIFYVSNLTMVLFLNRKNNLKHSNGHPKPLKSLLIKQNSGTLCSFKSHHKYCNVFSKRNIDIWIELQCILAAVKRLPNWQISKFRVWKKMPPGTHTKHNHFMKYASNPNCQIFFKSQTLTSGSFAALYFLLKHTIAKKFVA